MRMATGHSARLLSAKSHGSLLCMQIQQKRFLGNIFCSSPRNFYLCTTTISKHGWARRMCLARITKLTQPTQRQSVYLGLLPRMCELLGFVRIISSVLWFHMFLFPLIFLSLLSCCELWAFLCPTNTNLFSFFLLVRGWGRGKKWLLWKYFVYMS